ncbi:unnamed protein product [Boreogadus saida]
MDVRLVSGGPWAGCQDCQPLRCQRLAACNGSREPEISRRITSSRGEKAALAAAHLVQNKQRRGAHQYLFCTGAQDLVQLPCV